MISSEAGKNQEYRKLHHWITRIAGSPSLCEDCGTTVPRRYDWANLSGLYKQERSDWKRLCRPCHKKLDLGIATECKKGHTLTPNNLFWHKSKNHFNGGYNECRECIQQRHHKYQTALNNGSSNTTESAK